MKLLGSLCAQIFVVVVFVTLCLADGTGKGPKRAKLYHSLGLIPFPRIGRGGNLAWEIEQAGYPKQGRKFNEEDTLVKRTSEKTMNPGLWFGPRLGRFQKRSGGYLDEPFAYVLLGEAPVYRQTKFTPRLGRESDENFEYSEENQITTEHAA